MGLLALSPVRTQSTEQVAQIDAVEPVARVVVGGVRYRLQGLSLPADSVREPRHQRALLTWLRERAVGRRWRLRFEAATRRDGAEQLVTAVPVEGGESLNAAALRAGVALLACRSPEVAALDELTVAADTAQQARAGWFGECARPPVRRVSYVRGAVLPLVCNDPELAYTPRLDELAELGFRHVSLLISVYLRRVDSSVIEFHHPRTVRDERLLETIRSARAKGMTVTLLPIVLLREPGDDDWRGVLEPKDQDAFWSSYDGMLSRYLDIAESAGAEMVSVGSELGSLEGQRETWRRIIQNARGRFSGLLTYSTNWDHLEGPTFFDQLDAIGVTGYFSLTDDRDPTRAELEAGWRRAVEPLAAAAAEHGRPIIITELGYCSQDGANRDPWNYVMNVDDIDLREQRECFEAFMTVADDLPWLRGAWFYEFFNDGGVADPGYTPRGKPALRAWRRWARKQSPLVISRRRS